jgi:hypothetical protein
MGIRRVEVIGSAGDGIIASPRNVITIVASVFRLEACDALVCPIA